MSAATNGLTAAPTVARQHYTIRKLGRSPDIGNRGAGRGLASVRVCRSRRRARRHQLWANSDLTHQLGRCAAQSCVVPIADIERGAIRAAETAPTCPVPKEPRRALRYRCLQRSRSHRRPRCQVPRCAPQNLRPLSSGCDVNIATLSRYHVVSQGDRRAASVTTRAPLTEIKCAACIRAQLKFPRRRRNESCPCR